MTTADYEPNVVLSTKDYDVIGSRPIRPNGANKVTGRSLYGVDYQAAGLLNGKVLSSPHGHARIRSIDTSRAEALEGVRTSIFKDGETPAPGRMTLERHERLLVLTHAGGTRLNRTLGIVLASLLTSRAGEACGFQSDPYRVILDLPARLRARDVEQTVRALRPGLGPLLRLAVRSSPTLGPQLLHVARKMGAIAPDADVGRFGLRRLLAVAIRIRAHLKKTPYFLYHYGFGFVGM